MKKFKLFLFTLCIIFTSVSSNVNAIPQTDTLSPIPVLRLSGADRYGTAAAISKEGFKTSEYAVLASGDGDDRFADALSGSTLAYALGCPILLSTANELNQNARDEIIRLCSKKIVILGGPGAISKDVEKQLEDMGLSVERLWGDDRYGTAVKIAERLRSIKPVSNVFLTTGEEFQYAMMVSPYASRNNIPIIFTKGNTLSNAAADALVKWGVNKVDIIGNTNVISQSVEDTLHIMRIQTSRVSGQNMSETNINIINAYNMGHDYIAAARDDLFADSIAGAPFAASKNMNILLTGQTSANPSISDFLSKAELKCAYVFGGPGDLSDNIITTIRNGSLEYPLFGNTSGNIINGGLAASENGWIYYSNPSMGGKLYKKKLNNAPENPGDSSVNVELCSDVPSYINVIGNWIYYSNLSDGMKIYKIKTDGTCRLKLNDDESSNIIIGDNWIYYINRKEDCHLYRMACDGAFRTQLNNKKSKYLNVKNDWIYYLNAVDGSGICRLKMDNPKLVQKLTNIYANSMEVMDDCIYFSNRNDNSSLYKISIDGTKLTKLCSDAARFIHSYGSYIYYSNSGDGDKLYKIEADTAEKTKIYDGSIYLINIIEGNILFVSSMESPELICIKDDGTSSEQYEGSLSKDYINLLTYEPDTKDSENINDGKNEWVAVLPEDDGIPVRDAFKNDGKKIAFLTFDDGPSKDVTPAILDILKKNNIKATFFVVGRMVKNNGDVIKRIYSEGHTIANHGYSHEYNYIYSNTNNFMGEVNDCENALKHILGEKFTTRIFRFPGGAFGSSYTEYKAALKEHDYEYVDWNVSIGDSAGSRVPTAALLDNFNETSKGKDDLVILMHDLNAKTTTAEVLPSIIESLKSNGYEFKKLK